MEGTGEFAYRPRHTAYSRFMASSAGRTSRAVSGGALIGMGLARGGGRGFLVALIGMEPFLSSMFDFCLSSALMGGPFWGEEARAEEPHQ